MSSFFGQNLRLSLFGQSHGEAIGITLDGFPAGMKVDMDWLLWEMARRRPGKGDFVTKRNEPDQPEILSGIFNGKTTGQPICAMIRNQDMRSRDYGDGVDLPRPGHADYTGHIRYYGVEDWRGSGHFSGRLTAPITLAGVLCAQWLKLQGVSIVAHIQQLRHIKDDSLLEVDAGADLSYLKHMQLPVLRKGLEDKYAEEIIRAKEEGDSVGGVIECAIRGVPAGLGSPFFDSVESVLSHLLFSVPAVKAVEFGAGFAFAEMMGSEANDPFRVQNGKVVTQGNHCGGVLGGITDGMPIVFRVCIRPTPSIAKEQETVSLRDMENRPISIRGRHDPCILPRAVPVIEAVAALAVMDLWKERAGCIQ